MIISLKRLHQLTDLAKKIYTFLLFSFALGSMNATAFELTATDIQNIIDKDLRPFSGAIMISDNSKTYVNYQAGETIKPNSVFLIGSISKTVTATLVLRAVDQQKLTLTDNISDYLSIKTQHPVTIAQLLNHTSGILPPKSPSLIANSQFAPASQFSYSNYGYALLGQILTQVYQQPYSTLVTQFATQNKLDIQANIGSISAMYTQQPRLAQGYMEQQNQRNLLDDLTIDNDFLAFGGMQASTAGINQFLNGLHQGNFLSASSYQAMTNASTTRQHRWGEIGYGFGLQISQQAGVIEYSHSGYIPGYISLMLYYPQPQLTVVILENTSWDLSNIDRVFGLQDKIRQTVTEQLLVHE